MKIEARAVKDFSKRCLTVCTWLHVVVVFFSFLLRKKRRYERKEVAGHVVGISEMSQECPKF
jgi:hypothetical protein